MLTPYDPDQRLRAYVIYATLFCLVVVVVGAVTGVLLGIISVEALGTVSGAAAGGGFLMFVYVFYKIIRATLTPPQTTDRGPPPSGAQG